MNEIEEYLKSINARGGLNEDEKRIQDAAFEYCIKQKTTDRTTSEWLSMKVAKLIRRAFRAGAYYERNNK